MFKIFGKHYGTERFFILLLALFGVIVSLFSYSLFIKHEQSKFTVGNTPLYTGSYVWSRTSATGRVVKFVSDRQKTAAFLLIKNDDVTLTSTNADDYEVFMTGTDESLKNTPSMTVYSFGLTGYVGFYFKDARGFANQRVTLTVRANSAGSIAADESMFYTAVRDQSFRDNNQIRLVVNFGASGLSPLPVMDEPGLTPMKIMCDLNLDMGTLGISEVSSSYTSLCNRGQKQLLDMRDSLVSIAQYRATLTEQGIVVPDLPYYIANDRVDTNPNDITQSDTVFELAMLQSGGSGMSGTNFTGSFTTVPGVETSGSGGSTGTGKPITYTDDSGKTQTYYFLHTDYLFPGTCHIFWQGRKLSDGLINQTRFYNGDNGQGFDEAYDLYLRWAQECQADYAAEMPTSIKISAWRRTDGTYLDTKNATGLEKQVANMANNYVTEVNNYLKLKYQYLAMNNSMLASESAIQSLRKLVHSNNGSAKQNLWLY